MMSHSYSCIARTIVLWLTALVPLTSAFSQNQRVIDSLLTVLPERTGAEKYAVYHRLTAEYADWDNEKAFEFAKRAGSAAYALGDSSLIMKSQRLKGQILFRLGRPQAVISTLEPLVNASTSRNNTSDYLMMLALIGSSHLVMSQFDKALEFYFQNYELAKQVDDKVYVAMSLENIGVTYYKLKDYRKALLYMLRSFTLRKTLSRATSLSAMNVSLSYAHLEDFDNARKFLKESVRTCGANCSPMDRVHIKYASGLIHYLANEYDEAERDFLQSLQLSREVGDFRMRLDNIYLLSKIYIQRLQLKEARQLLAEGEVIIKDGVPYNMEMIKVYSELAEVYREMQNFKKATWYQTRYIALKDSIYDEKMTTALMRVESQYLEKANEEKLAAQDEIILLKEQMINRQEVLNVVSGFLILISLILVGALFIGLRQKRRFNRILAQKINERKLELERNHSILFSALQEQRTETRRLYKIILESSKTLQGLCHAATIEDANVKLEVYISNVRRCAAQLLQTVQPVFDADEPRRLDGHGYHTL